MGIENTSLEIDQRILYGLKSVGRLVAIGQDAKKLQEMPPLHKEANRRKVSMQIVGDDKFDTRTYSICDFKDDMYLAGKNYSAEELQQL